MKNDWLKRIGMGVIALFLLYGIVRLTGIIQFYDVPTSGNAPTINPGDKIIASNLSTYTRLDFVCYQQNNPSFPSGVWVRRVCGIPGDEIHIQNGTLYVNEKNVDQSISVMHDYYVGSTTAKQLQNEFNWPKCDARIDSCRISIVDKKVTKRMNAVRYINNEKGKINGQFNKEWTLDNFGPFVIPEGMLFLLGDNRHNSIDSRTTGLVPEADIVGVVIN